jgi:hypothetical protein
VVGNPVQSIINVVISPIIEVVATPASVRKIASPHLSLVGYYKVTKRNHTVKSVALRLN